jgi:RNA polymerase sigma-70 factor, ECF subfamily
MDTTSATLLDKVRQPTNQEAWQRFVSLYTPLLYGWALRLGLPEPDTADLVQDVFAVLLGKLCDFRYDREKSFRAWLRTVLHNKWRELKRGRVPVPLDPQEGVLADIAGPEADDGLDETEYRKQLVARALELVQGDFEPATWTAWSQYAVAGRPAAEVAGELGLSTHAVYLAKARVLRRLREELAGLLD